MAEDYNQAGAAATTGMCGGGGSSGGGGGGNWWDTGRSMSRFDAAGGSSTCSSNSGTHYGWLAETVDVNARSSMESSSTTSSSAVFHGGDVTGHKQRLHGGGGAANSASNSSTSAMLLDPNLQIMGLGLSSQTLDCWTQPLLRNHEKVAAEGSSFRSMLQEESGLVFGNSPVELMKQGGGGVNINRGGFSLDHDHHDQFSSSNNSMESTVTCQGGGGLGSSTSNHNNNHHQVHSFPLDSSSISSIYGTTSPSALLLQGLMGGQACGAASPPAADQQQQQQLNYGYHQQQQNNNSYGLPISISNNNTDLMSSWSNNNKVHHQHHQQQVVPQFLRAPLDPSPKQTLVQNQLHFTNNAPFWNASASTGMTTHDSRPTSFFPSLHTQLPIPAFEDKPIKQNPLMEPRDTASTTATSASSMKKNDQTTATATKRGRNENNSSNMPTIKVRKEKMGDRITALQQLVSPFGKTDTASVLSEAIEYIKFLHEQVNVLSTPYLKSGNASYQHQQQHIDHHHKTKVDPDGPKQDLRSRGLCLVPVSSTFPVAHETSVDFGTPSTLGGFFR